jgi:hypothetical protein
MTESRSRVAQALFVVAVVVALASWKEWVTGRDEVATADAAAARSDWVGAITHARAAAEALSPGSPWTRRGWLRLEAVGHDAEARGDDATALAAYSAMRAAALATRGVLSGSGAWQTKADEGLARVAGSQRTLGPHVSSESMLEALRSGETPSEARLAAMSLASLAVLGGLGWLALAADGSKAARIAKAVAAAGVVGYAVVVLGS